MFDGHGGKNAAEFAAENMPKFMAEELTKVNGGEIEGAVKRGYLKTDEEFLKIAANRTYNGPDADDVARFAKYRNSNTTIPPRYASIRDSGLVAEFSPTQKDIRIDLVD